MGLGGWEVVLWGGLLVGFCERAREKGRGKYFAASADITKVVASAADPGEGCEMRGFCHVCSFDGLDDIVDI